ncbi:MAG: ABC transporter ATP-binding protein/permease [Desulfobulbaceae bacterium]|nr:ABC transporter ATP-binding protein/permease [Desulfobulbaceae bacterium]
MRYDFGYFEEAQLGQVGDAALWRRILALVRGQWGRVATAVLLALVAVAAGLALPHLMRLAVDNYIVNRNLAVAARLNGLARLSLLFLALSLLGFLCSLLQAIVLERAGQWTMHRLRQHLFRHLLDLDLAFFNDNPGGKLVTRLTNDIQNMHEMFTSVIVTLFNDTLRLAGILALLFWMNWRLALLLTLLLPLITVNVLWFSRLARDVSRLLRTQLARINSFLQEALSGLTILQLLRREKVSDATFAAINDEYLRLSLQQIRIFGIFMPMIEVFSSLAIGLIIWYGGGEIIRERMSLGMLVAFLSYMRLFFQPARELSQKYSIVQSAMASAERIFELLDTGSRLALAPAAPPPQRLTGEVRFEDVTFGYQPDHPILVDLNLTVPTGETVAIVGATGAGKSTIINLLERFYDPDRGRVLLDNIDLRDLPPRWLRQQVGLVMQEVLIVPGTIADNILLDSSLDEEALRRVVADAQLDELIARLPLGLDTVIGEGGMALSAGQNQLLALARILARDPRILVLDEATANVDSATEILIERAVARTLANRTAIVIAHRLSTIRRAHRIAVIDQGRLVEEGDHQSLMARRGLYHRLQQLQSK